MKKIINVVAGAIIRNNTVFVAQRGNKGKTAFKYEFPGGKVEINETNEQALIREIKEELSVTVDVKELIADINDEYDDVILNIKTYRCILIKEEPKISEHINSIWATVNELNHLDFAPADKETVIIVKELLNGR